MSTGQPHLERRPTGYYWRRRLPASCRNRVKPLSLCFPLKTKDRLQAARIARSLTALSEICFTAEIDLPPEVMIHLLVSYARLEIEADDRLRATTGPRTRMAAQAALTVEAELRASLREAILCCDHTPAVDPVKLTAERLGIDLDDAEDDYAILCDKMLRMQIEISKERERRANGYFADKQPYLDLALSSLHATPTVHTTSIADSPAPTVAAADNTPEIVAAMPAPNAEQMADSTTTVNGPVLGAAESTDDLLFLPRRCYGSISCHTGSAGKPGKASLRPRNARFVRCVVRTRAKGCHPFFQLRHDR